MKRFKTLGEQGRITIPYDMRSKMGLSYNDIISFEETDRGVIVRKEKLCDNCCNNTSIAPIRPDEDAICDFIDSLPAEKQKATLFHLLANWDRIRQELTCPSQKNQG